MIRRYLAIIEVPAGAGEPYGVTVLGFPNAAVTTAADHPAKVRGQAEDALASAVEDLLRRGLPLPPSLDEGAWPDYDAAEFCNPLEVVISYTAPTARAA